MLFSFMFLALVAIRDRVLSKQGIAMCVNELGLNKLMWPSLRLFRMCLWLVMYFAVFVCLFRSLNMFLKAPC